MTVNVYSHAVANYMKRVLFIDPDMAGSQVKEFAKSQIKETIREPDIVYQKDDTESPIHIRNGAAVPVREEDGKKVAPTVYNWQTYLEKMDTDVRGQKAR